MRERYSNNESSEVERPSGALKENEIEEIRHAYRDGCKGEILIGLRGEERVITMLLPAQAYLEEADSIVPITNSKLKDMGCDKFLIVKRNFAVIKNVQR